MKKANEKDNENRHENGFQKIKHIGMSVIGNKKERQYHCSI